MTVSQPTDRTSPRQKAFELNLDTTIYGSLAEIGAGQEVARHFFQAGGASGTIAQTTSAYDMQFSDALYGREKSGRYVSRSRLESMLDREFEVLVVRLAAVRPPESRYFAFADTVAAKSYKSNKDGHGWMGIKFQHAPGAPASRVLIHVRMFDSSNLGQQESLGILGVNLIHGAFYDSAEPEKMISSLADNLVWGRIEIDFVELEGPAFEGVDNREMNLGLVTSSLGPVVTFTAEGRAEVPAELLYQKHALILRGTFRPFTCVHESMLESGLRRFAEVLDTTPDRIVRFCEVNVARYLSEGLDEVSDLLERVEMMCELGYNVMVTSHLRYFRLSEYFSKLERKKNLGFIVSAENLVQLFDDRFYDGMDGGILQAMAALFVGDAKLLAYPNLTDDGEVVTVDNVPIAEHLWHLYQYLLHNERILPLHAAREELVPLGQDDFIDRIARGEAGWEELVPEPVRRRLLAKLARQLAGPET